MIAPASANVLLPAWGETLARRGADVAVQATSGETLRTFADIEAEAQELAPHFAPLPPGTIVGLQMGNSERWPALLLALFRHALIPLPLGRHMEAAELQCALETCRAGLLVRWCPDTQLQLLPGPAAIPPHWTGPAPHFLKLTSGTTSVPRAIRFRAPQLLADAGQICTSMGLTERDLNFGVIPFSHSYGFSNLLLPLLTHGIPLVASEERMPRPILNDLARTRATVFPGMPVYFQKFGEMQNVPALPHLRLCISAGALLSAHVARRFHQQFGLKVHTFYGSSECGGIAYDSTDCLDHPDGFLGPPLAGVEILPDPIAPDRITVRSPAVGDGYFPDPDSGTLRPGHFTPGDLVRATPHGLYLEGRSTDLINIAGRKLNPLEVEAHLAQYPGIRQAIVFGVPSILRGEEAIACLAGDALDPDALQRYCHARLSLWQMPRHFWLLPEIPTDARGHIDRRTLAARFLAEKPRAPQPQ